jgi:hypothetical protein
MVGSLDRFMCGGVVHQRKEYFFLENSNPFLVRFVGGWNSPAPPVRGLAFTCNSCVWVGILLQLLYQNPPATLSTQQSTW